MPRPQPIEGGKWGIMGGAFDPIHYGHLVLAEQARVSFGLNGVMFFPCSNPPHREYKPTASFDDRIVMTQMAVADNEFFSVSDLEQEIGGNGYTIDLIGELKEDFPKAEWHLIIGADNISIFDTWHKPEEILKEVPVLVGARPGFESALAVSPWMDRMKTFEMPLMEISSTKIRKSFRNGISVRYMLPDQVWHYASEKNLYR